MGSLSAPHACSRGAQDAWTLLQSTPEHEDTPVSGYVSGSSGGTAQSAPSQVALLPSFRSATATQVRPHTPERSDPCAWEHLSQRHMTPESAHQSSCC